MTDAREWLTFDGVVAPQRVVHPDSLCGALLGVAARAAAGRDCDDLAYQPLLARYRGMPVKARREAVAGAAKLAALPTERTGQVDAEAVATWVTGHYPARRYPAAVLGGPHGAAVHLAAALGAPWLPTGFPLAARWPGGRVDDPAGALVHGSRVVGPLLAANAHLTVRQVYDPVARGVPAGSTIDLVARWGRLPSAYRQFLASRVAVGAPIILLRDARTWPVLDVQDRYEFQVGTAATGLSAEDYHQPSTALQGVLHALGGDVRRWHHPGGGDGDAEHGTAAGFEDSVRRWAGRAGRPLHRVMHAATETLSAAVADVLRHWIRDHGGGGHGCLVDCGRLLDPIRTTGAGLVPYWCEGPARRAVAGAEWWLAGSARFNSVDVVPAPPGVPGAGLAGLPQWRAVASFGRLRGQVDRPAARAYPLQPLPTRHVTDVLRARPYDPSRLPRLSVTEALVGLRDSASGLLLR